MPKGLDKIEGDFKKLQPKLKPLTKEAALKQLKAIATTLDKCWDQEDALQEALTAAREAGNAGKSASELDKDRGFKTARVLWEKAVAAQKAELSKLVQMIVAAKALLKDLDKLTTLATKEGKSAAKGSADQKAAEGLVSRLEAVSKELASVVKSEGKLKPAEKFYALQYKKILDKMIVEAGKGATAEADLPKLLEEAQLKRSAAKIKKLLGEILAAHKRGVALAEKDARAAESQLKAASIKLKGLKKLVDDYQKARKKCEKDIKEAANSKVLIDRLNGFDKALRVAEGKTAELANKVEKATA